MDNMDNQKNNILAAEKEILAEEKEILKEVKKEEKMIKRMLHNSWVLTGLAVFVILAATGGLIYWQTSSGRIYTDKAQISAPLIQLAPQTRGILNNYFVQAGDSIKADTPVAQIGDELVKNQAAGLVVSVQKDIGKLFNPGEAVVTMIDPSELRVVGQIEEDKGLRDVRIGERAIFTVDAFGSKQYQGVVDEISQTSRAGDIVFSISDQRQSQQFNVYVRFNPDQYPELKNGMSVKLWIYKN